MCAVLLISQNASVVFAEGFFPKALANDPILNPQDPDHHQLGLIAILVEEELLKDIPLKDAITAYGQRAQEQMDHSRAFVISVPKNTSALSIASTLERLYLNGLDLNVIDGNPLNNLSKGKDDNQLAGVVLVGDLPLPVVSEETGSFPSLYPYTDFVNKAYIYNHETQLFEKNESAGEPLPEVWHGVIRATQNDPQAAKEELLSFFQKNAAYYLGDAQFSDVEKRLLYADFTAMQQQMNWMDYKNYDRYTRYMEESAFNRYNKTLLKQMIGEVSSDLGSDEPILTDEAIDEMTDLSTEQVFQKYLLPLGESLQVHLGKINDALAALGRWSKQEIDTPAGLITVRDAYAQGELLRKQLLLEQEIENTVKAASDPVPLITGANFKVNLTLLGFAEASKDFYFTALADGQVTGTLEDMNSCGMYRGQVAKEGQTPLENNSIYVEANQMYDLESLVKPPPNDITDNKDYKKAAGCVFNNSVESAETNLSPTACLPHKARKPLLDILGSKEVKSPLPEDLGWGRCRPEDLNFHPSEGLFPPDVEQSKPLDETLFKKRTIEPLPEEILGNLGGTLDQLDPSLEDMINSIYAKLLQEGLVEPQDDLILKTDQVLQFLGKNGEEFIYAPHPKVEVKVSVSYDKKSVDSLILHNEPTAETLNTLYHIGEPRVNEEGNIDFPPMITPSIPADGVRGISFYKNGEYHHFEYPNLFRVEGSTPESVIGNLAQTISEKEAELSEILEEPVKTMSDFVGENAEMVEPLAWKNLSPDEKLKEILFKYTDGHEKLPTVTGNLLSAPTRKPTGYEALYIRAQGNSQGFNMALTNAMESQDPQVKTDLAKEKKEEEVLQANMDENLPPEDENKNKELNVPDPYLCGDPKGVEIWEWFAALQCWFTQEVIPDENFFSLDGKYSKSFEDAVAPGTEDGKAFESQNVLNDLLPVASHITIENLAQNIVVGQSVSFQVSALNKEEQPVMGYLKEPLKLNLGNPALGDLSESEFNLYTGKKTVTFQAQSPGKTTLTLSMNGVDSLDVPINILPPLEIKWKSQEVVESGKSTFYLDLQLFDNKGNTITDFDGEVTLAPLNQSDGGFLEEGKVLFKNAKASTQFFPVPGKPEIELLSRSPFVQGDPYKIFPSSPPAYKLQMDPPTHWPVGESLELTLRATDEYGFTSFDYEKQVIASVRDSSGKALYQGLFNMVKGETQIAFPPLKEAGMLRLEFSSGELNPLKVTLPGNVTLESSDLEGRFPRSLFVAFDGFAAGNVFAPDYLAGAQLHSGLTQAVFAHMQDPLPEAQAKVSPFYQISLSQPNQQVMITPGEGALNLEVFDAKNLKAQLQFKVPLNLTKIVAVNPEEMPQPGTLAVDVLNQDYTLKQTGEVFDLLNQTGQSVARFEPKALFLPNGEYKLTYSPNENFPGLLLNLENKEEGSIARLFFALEPSSLSAENFKLIDPNWVPQSQWGGQSTQEATGVAFYAKKDMEAKLPEATATKAPEYLKSIASGVAVGEAVRWDLPLDGILLGDPLLKLSVKSNSSLPYDYSSGQPIFRDANKSQIVSVQPFNFNADEFEDLALAMDDGRVKLLEGGPTQTPFKERGDLAFLADGTLDLETLDLENDGYEDLLLATNGGRLAILNNRKELITRSDQIIEIGKKLYSLQAADMDSDGYDDLVTLDSRGDLKIFYYNPDSGSFPSQGKLVDNYGFNLKLDKNLGEDIKIRYAGLQTPDSGLNTPQNPSVNNLSEALNQEDNISDEDKQAFFDAQQALAQAARQDPSAGLEAAAPPLLSWPEGEESETYFAPTASLAFLQTEKTVENLSHPNDPHVDLEDQLQYTLQITSNAPLTQVVLADVLPDSLLLEGGLNCIQSCEGAEISQKGTSIFVSGLNLNSGTPVVLSYKATVQHTPKATFNVQRLSEPAFLSDAYNDIVVSPAYNPTAYVVQHYSTAPRDYKKRSNSEDEQNAPVNKALDDFSASTDKLSEIEPGENSSTDDLPKIPGVEAALDELTGADKCFESVKKIDGCVAQKLSKVSEKVAEFGCQGNGCFPTPWNYSFLVPPQMPFPVFAAPTTLITAAGPTPSVWPVSTFLGVANIKGTYNSKIRFYVSPTLTGGIGLAMCWGNYSGNSKPPIAKVPIPYPPPSGNCMVTALPADKMPWGKVCTEIESQVNQLMDSLNSGISKVNSAISDLNNNQSIPVNLNPSNPQGGAGGLEMEVGVNLGQLTTYDPPLQANTNIHLPTFDSISGVLSDWVDRQTLEISNKLLTLPSITLYLPEVSGFVARDAEKLENSAKAWFSNMSKSAEATQNALSSINKLENSNDEKRFERYKAVENQMSLYNNNALQGLYDVASTLSLLNITQVPVEVNVPWISNAEVTAYIGEMQQWLLYYEKELARVKDQWEKLSCPAESTETAIQEKMTAICERPGSNRCTNADGSANADELKKVRQEAQAEVGSTCAASQIAQRFIVDFEEVKHSVEQNIEVLHSYLAFPKQLVSYKQQVAAYVESVAGFLDTIAQLTGGWLATIQQQLITWAEVIITIKEVVLNIKELFDIFTNFDTQCSLCANERNSNFGWWSMLGLILPDIPIISFPKLPNIVLDLSQMEGQIDLEVPVLDVNPKPIPLPPLPYFSLPEFPDINLTLKLPPLPVLPALPNLPALPALPPIPTFNLPTLPPPPKLPDVGKSLEVVSQIIQQILNIWCLVKKSLTPIPESMLNSQISLITSRPAYLTPIDLLQVELPKIAPFDLGFNEVHIENSLKWGIRLDAMPEAVKKVATQWNQWMKVLPDVLNEQYANSLALSETYVQEIIDYQDKTFGQAIDFVENEFAKAQQEAAKPFAEAQKWAENQEATWQEWVNTQEEKTNEKINMTYDEYVTAVHKTNQLLGQKNAEWEQKITAFMEKNNDIFQVMNVLLPLGGKLQTLDMYGNDEKVNGILNLFTSKMEDALPKGPAAIYELFDEIQACLKDKSKCPALNTAVVQEAVDQLSYQQKTDENAQLATKKEESNAIALASGHDSTQEEGDLDQQMQALLNKMQSTFQAMAHAPLVDYKKVKEDLGIPNVNFYAEHTFLDDLKTIQNSLYSYQNELQKQAAELDQSDDLYAWLNTEFGVKNIEDSNDILAMGNKELDPLPSSTENENVPAQPASLSLTPLTFADEQNPQSTWKENKSLFHFDLPTPSKTKTDSLSSVLSSAVPEALALEGENPIPELGYSAVDACTSGLCLFNPETATSVAIVPVIENNASSQIAFLKNGDVVYSDSATLYLKPDLSKEPSPLNTNNGSVNVISFKNSKLNPEEGKQTFEAVNNLKANFAENNQVQVSWKASSNPLTYGYGLQVERSILGYDADQQKNDLPDLSVVLLPKSETGEFPLVEVDGQKVEPGTLITLYDDAQSVQKLFGLRSNTVLNKAKQVTFPSLGNMAIDLSPTRAVYVDTLSGSSYRLPLENGFYQLKTLWFTNYGQTSTYSPTVLLAPQSYGGVSAPVDVTNDPTVYLPVYQSKILKATDFLLDLSGIAEYQWFVGNSKVAVVGDTLELPAQNQPGQFLIKLVAVQKQGYTVVNETQKSFPVVVYSPQITLDEKALKTGVIAGNMTPNEKSPEEDLTGVPFSVLRQREGVWKNLGTLAYQEGRTTQSAFDPKTGSYRSLNSQGKYQIEGWNKDDPSALVFKDVNGQWIAKVHPGTGYVELINPGFKRVPLAATQNLPTRIALIHQSTQEVAGYVYYRAPEGNPIELSSVALTPNNIAQANGVLVADLNANDDFLISFLPNDAPSLPGGVLLHNIKTQEALAMISPQGDMYLLSADYALKLKPEENENESPIFQVTDKEGKAVMEFFIPANFNQLQIAAPALKAVEPAETQATKPLSSPSQSPAFKDVNQSNPYYSAIEALFSKGLLKGYEDGNFRPEAFISRAEFVKVALGGTHCFDCTLPSDPILSRYASVFPFPDVKDLSAWFYFCIAMAKELGMVTGYKGGSNAGSFKPLNNINRAEAVTILLREAKIPLISAPKGYFADVIESAWYKDYIYTAFTMGLVQQNAGFVKPEEDLTRGEFAFMAENILNLVVCEEVDIDADGLSDGFEMENNLDPFTPDAVDEKASCECVDSPYQGDRDEDGIVDVCDSDLDNDGIENPICIFTATGEVNQDRLKALMGQNNTPVDNCLFVSNSDQTDSNADGRGDRCEGVDLCPDLPEDNDGVEDEDGCPEVESLLIPQEAGVYAEKGPLCEFIDYEADLIKGDKVMTAITDLQTHQVVYSQSKDLTYSP